MYVILFGTVTVFIEKYESELMFRIKKLSKYLATKSSNNDFL
jgi:hypothetical protein